MDTASQNKRLLYVDKDSTTLIDIKGILTDKVDLLHATSSLEALSLLNKVTIEVIISDQDLPDQSGLDMLKQIYQDYPETSRILISSDTELDTSIKALNQGIVEQIIRKPIDRNDLTSVLNRLFQLSALKRDVKQNQQEFEAFFHKTTIGVSQLAADLSFVNMNQRFSTLTGYSTEELLRKNCEDLLLHSSQVKFHKIKQQLVDNKLDFIEEELLLQHKNGNTFWVMLNLSQFTAFKDAPPSMIATWKEIADERMAENFILKHQESLGEISQNGTDWFWEIDDQANYLYLGANAEKTLGISTRELIGQSFYCLISVDDKKNSTLFQESFAENKPILNFKFPVVCKNDQKALLRINAAPILDSTGDLRGYRGVCQNITDPKTIPQQNKLELQIEQRYSELNRLSRVIEQGPLSISIINRQGQVDYINPKYTETTGFGIEDLLTQKHPLLISEDIPPRLRQEIWETIDSGKTWQGEISSQKKRGGSLCENVTFSPIRDSLGKISHFLVFSEDASEKKEAEAILKKQVDELDANRRAMLNMMEDLENAKSEAELATQAKSAFLANMSHEIRTPMNAVLGFISLVMEDPDITRPQHRNLMIAYTSAKSLLGLINDILDISKLESGKMELDELPIYLPKLVNDTLQTLDVSAREKGLNLIINIDHKIPQTVIGDPSRLKQILINLIGNAIKFTEKGSVSITVSPWQDEGYALFSIVDTGVGIDSERLKTIFDPFTQADGSTSRRHGGTGLGTTISRQLVELMGGKIWVTSEQGKGSSFHFTARLMKTDQAPQNLELESDAIGPELKGPHHNFRILLVEDIETNRTLAKIRLEQQGHQVHIACNGFEAIEVFIQEKIDVILMDIQMPDMDGIEATRQIRQLPSKTGFYIPIIALTASVMTMDIEHYKEVGMDSVVGKPIDFNQLFTIMEKVVPRGVGELSMDLPIQAPTTELSPMPDLKEINIKRALRTWQNSEAYLTALKGFATDHRYSADELSLKIGQGEISEARQLLHALKGVAGNLSMDTVMTVADQIGHELKVGQEGNIADLLSQLSQSLQIIIEQVDRLELKDAKLSQPKKKLEPEKLKNIFMPLITAFDQYNPDSVTPYLEELKEYLAEEQIAPISKQIDQFNFDAAKHETSELAKSLSVGLA